MLAVRPGCEVRTLNRAGHTYAVYAIGVNILYAVDAGFAFRYVRSMDEPNSVRIITPMSKSLVAAIDDFRFAQRVPSRAEATRQLIEAGLAAAKDKADG